MLRKPKLAVTMKRKLLQILVAIAKRWKEISLLICVLGALLSYAIPPLRKHTNAFLVLCAIVVVQLVLDIRQIVSKSPLPAKYTSLHEAITDIDTAMRKAMAKKRKKPLEIRIVAGRTMTVANMLKTLGEDVRVGRLLCRETKVMLFCVDPSFAMNLDLSIVRDKDAFQRNMGIYAATIESNCKTLAQFNLDEECKRQGLSFEVVHYKFMPTFFSFLIGNELLYWGSYTWDDVRQDFDGPINPCFRVDHSNEFFVDTYEWQYNRTEFLWSLAKREEETLSA